HALILGHSMFNRTVLRERGDRPALPSQRQSPPGSQPPLGASTNRTQSTAEIIPSPDPIVPCGLKSWKFRTHSNLDPDPVPVSSVPAIPALRNPGLPAAGITSAAHLLPPRSRVRTRPIPTAANPPPPIS